MVALLPFGAFLAVFTVYPLWELVRLSFTETSVVDGLFVSTYNGLENYRKIFEDPVAIESMKVTAWFIVLCVVITVLFGLIGALLVNRAVLMLGIARNIFVWPAVVAPVVVSVMWLLMLDPTIGGLNKVLMTLGMDPQFWLNTKRGAFIAIVAVDVWHWTPVVFLFLYTGLKGISNEILEAARVDGASERQVLFWIILPMLMPSLIAVTLLRIVMSVKAFDEMFLLTRGGPENATNLLSLHIRYVFVDVLDFGYAGALSLGIVALLIVTVGGSYGIRQLRRKAVQA